MLEIEIDGKKVEVSDGSTVMDAANKAGTFIPHFCYHKKLSIAANCRMCLVEVEKAPKALPACATPVTAGMKVMTNSEKAVKAQKSVMEFLLINHPLDCPICDQGGECQLQDLAMGYGSDTSRYKEEKRVVFNKNLGPLIATDMTRCIHCTRCVRFGQEIAGVMELGMANRGEHSEITTFLGRSVDSELSGNVIDLCPVGALTSKPFRFAARTWELARRRSISPHDSFGSNLVVQVKHDDVLRVLPYENEEVNECWLSDKDRFSYEGLTSSDRFTEPRIKHGGVWHVVDWPTALEYVVRTLTDIQATHGGEQIGALISPQSTVEEMFLAQRLLRGLGSENVDFRLRQSDFSLDGKLAGVPWLGTSVASLSKLDGALVIGSFLRQEQPLVAQKLRRAAQHGAKISRVHVVDEDWLLPISAQSIVRPSQLVNELSCVLAVLAERTASPLTQDLSVFLQGRTPSDASRDIASALLSGEQRSVILGNFAVQHPQYSAIYFLGAEIARIAGATFGVLGEGASSVGGYLAGAVPGSSGFNASQMVEQPLRAYIVLGGDPELDTADGAKTLQALSGAGSVVYLGSFLGSAPEYADVMLPITPFTETSGTYVNMEGRVQHFSAVVKGKGESRPGWKVLRVLGSMLGIDAFEYESSEAVYRAALESDNVESKLATGVLPTSLVYAVEPQPGLERISDVPIYFGDSLVRRSEPLQKTRLARVPEVRVNAETAISLGLENGKPARVIGTAGDVVLQTVFDDGLPTGVVRVSAAHSSTVPLGSMVGTLKVEPV